MAIQFKEIRQYLARNARLSICFEDGYYQDYLMVSDIPTEKYKDLYVYGIGMVDVEFPKDIYTSPQNLDDASSSIKIKECTFEPAIEIVLHKIPRDIKRKAEELLLFKDIKPYLQIGRNFAVVNREDWSYRLYEWKRDIPDEYDDKFVFGIGMEDNFDENDKDIIKALEKRSYDSCMNKRMVIVLSDTGRTDIENVKCEEVDSESTEAAGLNKQTTYGKGPFFLLVTADEWNHDDDQWLGIYVSKKEASRNNSSKMSILVIDDLWLMATQNTYTTKKEEIEEILSKIKQLVEQEIITVLALVLLSKYAPNNYSLRKELESYGNFIRWADLIVKSSSEI